MPCDVFKVVHNMEVWSAPHMPLSLCQWSEPEPAAAVLLASPSQPLLQQSACAPVYKQQMKELHISMLMHNYKPVTLCTLLTEKKCMTLKQQCTPTLAFSKHLLTSAALSLLTHGLYNTHVIDTTPALHLQHSQNLSVQQEKHTCIVIVVLRRHIAANVSQWEHQYLCFLSCC